MAANAEIPDVHIAGAVEIPLSRCGQIAVSASCQYGNRRLQEDRVAVLSHVIAGVPTFHAAVCDGTVGEEAVEAVHNVILPSIVGSKPFSKAATTYAEKDDSAPEVAMCCAEAMQSAFETTDASILRTMSSDWSACTCVTASLLGSLLTVAHVGDSKAVIGKRVDAKSYIGRFVTNEHRPDAPSELARITVRGGAVVYLHGGKPYLRGGDFDSLRTSGERPMQLNYSRAFGGRKLKPFGLTAEPTVMQTSLSVDDCVIILASDGLWDVMGPDTAVQLAMDSLPASIAATTQSDSLAMNPASRLTSHAAHLHDGKRTSDNISAVVLFLARPWLPA